jgi:hypothetical protein
MMEMHSRLCFRLIQRPLPIAPTLLPYSTPGIVDIIIGVLPETHKQIFQDPRR